MEQAFFSLLLLSCFPITLGFLTLILVSGMKNVHYFLGLISKRSELRYLTWKTNGTFNILEIS